MVVALPRGSENQIFQRCLNLDAQRQWTGIFSGKGKHFTKKVMGLGNNHFLPIRTLWLNCSVILNPSPSLAIFHNERQTHETGAGGKESGLFKCKWLEKMGTHVLTSLFFNISVQEYVWVGREKESRTNRSRGEAVDGRTELAGSVPSGPDMDL